MALLWLALLPLALLRPYWPVRCHGHRPLGQEVTAADAPTASRYSTAPAPTRRAQARPGHRAGLVSWWVRHKVFMVNNNNVVEIAPHGVFNLGRSFNVFMEPAP